MQMYWYGEFERFPAKNSAWSLGWCHIKTVALLNAKIGRFFFLGEHCGWTINWRVCLKCIQQKGYTVAHVQNLGSKRRIGNLGGFNPLLQFPTQTRQKWMFFLPSSNGFPHIPHTLGIWGQSAILAQPPFRQVLDSREAPQSGGDLRKDCRIGQSHRGPTNGWEREFIR